MQFVNSFNFNHSMAGGSIQIASSVGGGTVASVAGRTATARHTLVRNLTIRERVVGAFPAQGGFELIAPAGFSWRADLDPEPGQTNPITGHADSRGFATSFNAGDSSIFEDLWISPNGRTARVEWSGLERTGAQQGTAHLTLYGLTLVANDWDRARTGVVPIEIRSATRVAPQNNVVNGRPTLLEAWPNSVSAETINFGTIADWTVTLSALEAPTELISGRLVGTTADTLEYEYHMAARVRIDENILRSWNLDRVTTLQLPEGVTVRQAEVVFSSGNNNTRALYLTDLRNEGFVGTPDEFLYTNTNQRADTISIDGNRIHITNLRRANNGGARPGGFNEGIARLDLDLWLSVDIGFEGDIEIELVGSAITNADAGQSVKIAEAVAPIRLETTVANVRVGHQFVPVNNFTIIENVAGGLLEGEEVFISLTDDIFSELHIGPSFLWDTTGDIDIRNMRLGQELGGFHSGQNAPQVVFEIASASTEPSSIVFTNVQARLLAASPVSTIGYDLVVWGPAVAQNVNHSRIWETGEAGEFTIATATQWASAIRANEERGIINPRDLFSTVGVREPFVRLDGGTGGFGSLITEPLRMPVGFGEPGAYISTATGALMVPLRFVSETLGLEVLWSAETSTATILGGARGPAQFVSNSTEKFVGGVWVPMLDIAGNAQASEISSERMFIPFRQVGYALGLEVDWDPATNTGILLPPAQ